MSTVTLAWLARSYSDAAKRYVITREGEPTVGASSRWGCSCPSFTLGGRLCKHLRDMWQGIREGRDSERLARLGLACDPSATSFLLRCIASEQARQEQREIMRVVNIVQSAKGKATTRARTARLATPKTGALPSPPPVKAKRNKAPSSPISHASDATSKRGNTR